MAASDQSCIYVLCPCISYPNRAVRQLYHHVEILNRNGFLAFIAHPQPGFTVSWFQHQAAVTYVQNIKLGEHDFLVFPGDAGPDIMHVGRRHKKIVFNQDCYKTFLGFPFGRPELRLPYQDRDFVASFVVSDDSKAYLEYAFPKHKVYRIHPTIDRKLFYPIDNKKKQICYMPNRNAEDAEQVLHILRQRNALRDFKIVVMDGATDAAVATTLRESVFFLSFGQQEGFSFPAAEAMACGCVVVGYHGFGGKEFFRPEFSHAVAVGDVVNYARTVEKLIDTYHRNPEGMLALGREASKYIAATYADGQEERDTMAAWRELMTYRGKAYYFHDTDTVISDFAEFSNEDIRSIESRMNDFHELAGNEWDELPQPDYAGKASRFYSSSKFYIYDLLTANFGHQIVLDKLNHYNPQMLKMIASHPGKKFLEFGGGLGVVCEIVQGLGKDVTYLDIPGLVSEFAAWRFKKYDLPVRMIMSNPEKLELQDAYDIIYSDGVLEHVVHPEQIVQTLCEHLNPGGIFVLIVDLAGPSEKFPMHRHVDIKSLHSIMRENGLTSIQGEGAFCSIWKKDNN